MKNSVLKTIIGRWKANTPKFFKWIMGVSASVGAVALAVQMQLDAAGAAAPQWWTTAYPYLVGISAGMAATAKLTRKH